MTKKGGSNRSWVRRTFPEHVGIKGVMTINRASANQKAHSSYML